MQLLLREGRKREVKRMMMALGHPVLQLQRISFAGLTTQGMNVGDWRRLTDREIARILKP